MPPALLQLLSKELNITKRDTLIGGGRYHNMKDLMRFPNSRADLAFEKMAPARHPILDNDRGPMLDIVKRRDVLVTYPYQSFDHVVRLLREAAIDPKVRSIKMTLYRAARSSQIVNALFNAVRNGKKVVLSVELQARFDEMQNIQISEKLQEVGATVVYGVPPMKVHGKLMLIERDGFSVAGLSTGNFNETTGRLYVDSTLLTADPRLTEEVAVIFEFLENAAKMRMLASPKFKHLLVSPFNVRKTLNKLLDREAKKGDGGPVFLKVNHLTDQKIIARIRAAADAGVNMDLVVRTNYAMLPHKNIRAISILDRYLEHQRVLMFGNGPDRCVYFSSSDLMERNLDWRIEVAFPILAPDIQQQVADMMTFQVGDTCKARILDETQSNHYAGDGTGACRAQYDTYHYLTRASGIG
jgi:polyphosphate kinase